MKRKNEGIRSAAGLVASIAAVGGPVEVIVGTVPCAIVGGTIGLLGGNKVGSEIDRT